MFGKKKPELDFEFSEAPNEAEETSGDFHTPLEAPEGKPKKGSSTRLLMLLLLLVVAAGGAWFYLGATPSTEQVSVSAPAPKPIKQPIAMPVPSAPAVAKSEGEGAPQTAAVVPSPAPAADTPSAAGAAAPQADSKSVEKAPPAVASTPAAQKPASSAPAPITAAVQPKATEPKTAAPIAAVATKAAAPTTAEETKIAPPSKAVSGQYRVDAGVYLLMTNRQEAERIIRKLGYKPQVSAIKRPVEMVRLRFGTFPAAEGEARLQELLESAPDAFSLPQGDRVTVYAGSFSSIDRARSFADQLYVRGIEITEEKTTLPMTMYRVSFGPFSSQAAARDAAKRVQAAGLETKVSGP